MLLWQGAGGSSVVDNNNKKNLDGEKLNDLKVTQKPKNNFFADDGDDDPFFDDPIPSNNNTKSFTRWVKLYIESQEDIYTCKYVHVYGYTRTNTQTLFSTDLWIFSTRKLCPSAADRIKNH